MGVGSALEMEVSEDALLSFVLPAHALHPKIRNAESKTDSSMFQANETCEGMGTQTVENGEMTFHVSLRSKKILNLYLGTAEDAKQNESEWLQPTTDTVTYKDGTSEEVYGFASSAVPRYRFKIFLERRLT